MDQRPSRGGNRHTVLSSYDTYELQHDQHGTKTLGVQQWKAWLDGNQHLFGWMETMPGSGNPVNYAVLEENLQVPLY